MKEWNKGCLIVAAIYSVFTNEWFSFKTGCYPSWTPIMMITFFYWMVLPPHFHRNVRVLLSCVLQQRWIRRAAKGDNHLLPWPPRSSDLTPCDFFLLGFVKDSVYLPTLPMSLNELHDQITHALQTTIAVMLHLVWDEFEYRVDVCHVTQGAHIEGLWLTHKKLGHLPLLTVYVLPV